MTDLFTPTHRVGQSNALFLADLATGATSADLRRNIDAGKYPELGKRFVRGWMVLAGREVLKGREVNA